MEQEGIQWFSRLAGFVEECRAARPLAKREDLSHADEMQCRVLGGSLLTWLEDYGPRLLQERAVLAHLKKWEKNPFIVFTSSQPGLVAAHEIIEKNSERIQSLYPREFTSWLESSADSEYRWHIHTWSYFTSVDSEGEIAERHPLSPGESYWLHKEGTMCGQLSGRGASHLWKWDGSEPTLLQECLERWTA